MKGQGVTSKTSKIPARHTKPLDIERRAIMDALKEAADSRLEQTAFQAGLQTAVRLVRNRLGES